MLVYRVFPFEDGVAPGTPGAPEYLHKPQGKGRLDNPNHYDVWYFASTPEGAVGETFGDLTEWGDDMFEFPAMPGSLRALGVFEVPDDIDLLDLDDAKTLLDRGLRPTQVISRSRATTQDWALRIFHEENDRGERKWSGVRWWSFHRPHWTVFAVWYAPSDPVVHEPIEVQLLHVGHPAVADAAQALAKPLIVS